MNLRKMHDFICECKTSNNSQEHDKQMFKKKDNKCWIISWNILEDKKFSQNCLREGRSQNIGEKRINNQKTI